jgi:cytochrome c
MKTPIGAIAIRVLLLGGALVSFAKLSAPDVRAADASAGQQVFVQCAACHSTDGSAGTGPTLKGIVGRGSASISGFAYSGAMKRAHLTWTPDQLDKYITDPQAAVPGNTMPFAGMPDAQQRAALIAYLGTLK